MTGIEPALSAWEAEVLPLNYIRALTQEQPYRPFRGLGMVTVAELVADAALAAVVAANP